MKYIVTGGAGFIGSHLARRLISDGHEVIVVDDLSLGKKENVPKGVVFVQSSCSDFFNGTNLAYFSRIKYHVDGVFHLGIPASSPMYKNSPGLAGTVIKEFEQILRFCAEQGCKLVYASTSSIYNGNPLPWHENMTIQPTDIYTEARYCMERLAKIYYDLYDVKSVGLRLFSVYGPGEEHKGKFANIINQVIWAAKKKEKFVIYGDGFQGRDFIFVDDVVEAFVKAMNSNIKCDIFNIGTGKMTTFTKIMAIVAVLLNMPVETTFVENPIKNYVYRTLADTKKAEKILNFKATVSLEEGIKRCL